MDQTLTIIESYRAMLCYLEDLYQRTNSDDLGAFLGAMQFSDDGSTMDPAAWEDWLDAVQKIKEAREG